MFGSQAVPLSLRRTCRDVLALSGWESEGLVIGLTSSLPREGVTTVTLCMAAVFAETNRVLVIDASFSRRSAARTARLERKVVTAADLGDIDSDSLNGWVTHCEAAGFDLLSLEPSPHIAAALGFAWPRLRGTLLQRYRIVLIDLGSLRTQLSPAWATLINRNFVVVDAVRTTTEDLCEARQSLEILKLPVTGAILNRRAAERRSWFGGAE